MTTKQLLDVLCEKLRKPGHQASCFPHLYDMPVPQNLLSDNSLL